MIKKIESVIDYNYYINYITITFKFITNMRKNIAIFILKNNFKSFRYTCIYFKIFCFTYIICIIKLMKLNVAC